MMSLSDNDIEQFIRDGFVRMEAAFPREVAEEACRLLWQKTGCDPHDAATWRQPVVRIGDCAEEPFKNAVNTARLHAAFDQLVGKGNWLPRNSLGTFPVRFPSQSDPGDTGWHVDASFPGESPADFLSWRINIRSKGRALLMLFLFSDTSVADAPTRIRAGSHLEVARILEPTGEEGMSCLELAGELHRTAHLPEVVATGAAGTVYLCHPFVVHAAQKHCGQQPRFLAQPPLLPSESFGNQPPHGELPPVQKAIRMALGAKD